LGDNNWLAALDDEDLVQFTAEMREALNAAVTARDAGPVETCLREWRATGEVLADPRAREALTGAWDLGDFGEVLPP
jgi:Family of unknown function (DUF6247)